MNKKLLSSKLFFAVFAFSLAYSTSLKAQDIIILNTGEEFKSKVDEVLESEIKYYKWENSKGPKYSIKKTEVFMIRYQSGFVENYSTSKVKENKQNINDTVKRPNQTNVDEDLKFSLSYNSGTAAVINTNLINDFWLSNLNNSYFDIGIGLDSKISESRFWGIGLVMGAQMYTVDKAKFFSHLKSGLIYGDCINDWYVDDNLIMGKFGIQTSYTQTDKTNLHRLKVLFSLSDMIVGDFGGQFVFNNIGTIYMRGVTGNSLSIESAVKYEHRLYKKLGIEFNFGITITPMSTNWKTSNNVNAYTTSNNASYGLFQIKAGTGLLLY